MNRIRTPEQDASNRGNKLSLKKKVAIGAAAATAFGIGTVTVEQLSSDNRVVCSSEDPSSRDYMTQPLGVEVCAEVETETEVCEIQDPMNRDYMTQPLGEEICKDEG